MKKAFDVLQMRGIMEDDPYRKAFLQAGYFETAGVWIKRVGTQIILIQLMTDSIDLEINGKWDQAFWFADTCESVSSIPKQCVVQQAGCPLLYQFLIFHQ